MKKINLKNFKCECGCESYILLKGDGKEIIVCEKCLKQIKNESECE